MKPFCERSVNLVHAAFDSPYFQCGGLNPFYNNFIEVFSYFKIKPIVTFLTKEKSYS